MRDSTLKGLLLVFLWGCAPGDTDAKAASGSNSESLSSVWVASTPSGLEVTVRPGRIPIQVGMTEFHISFTTAVSEDTPISIDVVSPEMPSMGVVRFPADPVGDGKYLAHAEIGMEGLWIVYVNLGDGTDAASFEFHVEPGEAGGHQHGGGTQPAESRDREPADATGAGHTHGGGR